MSRRKPPARPQATAASRQERELGELARQGAKSAARGEPSSDNPMEQHINSPPSTGETLDTWRGRRDAWQRGHAAQSRQAGPGTPDSSSGGRDGPDEPR